MAPKRIHGEKPRRAPKGFLASTYDTLTSPDNAAVVRSIAMFSVSLQKAHRIRRCDKYETNPHLGRCNSSCQSLGRAATASVCTTHHDFAFG